MFIKEFQLVGIPNTIEMLYCTTILIITQLLSSGRSRGTPLPLTLGKKRCASAILTQIAIILECLTRVGSMSVSGRGEGVGVKTEITGASKHLPS